MFPALTSRLSPSARVFCSSTRLLPSSPCLCGMHITWMLILSLFYELRGSGMYSPIMRGIKALILTRVSALSVVVFVWSDGKTAETSRDPKLVFVIISFVYTVNRWSSPDNLFIDRFLWSTLSDNHVLIWSLLSYGLHI